MLQNFYKGDFYQVFLHGLHSSLGGQVPDPTFGRRDLPLHPFEAELRNNPKYWWCEEFIQVNNPTAHLNSNSSSPTTKRSFSFDRTESRRRGPNVYLQSWYHSSYDLPPQAEIIIVHGIAAYGGYLTKLVPIFCQSNVRVHLLDLPGHGRSDGIHVDLSNMDQLVEALNAVVSRVRLYQPNLPLFVLGYSLGGLVAINHSLKYPNTVSGLNLIAPCVKLKPRFLKASRLISFGKLVAFLTPRLVLPTPSEPRDEKADKSNSEKPPINSDSNDFNPDEESPLIYKRSPRVGTLIMILNATLQLPPKLTSLKLPFFVQQGELDQVLDPRGAVLLQRSAKSTDKRVRIYPELQHDMFSSAQVIGDSVKWITRQIKRHSSLPALPPPTPLVSPLPLTTPTLIPI